MEAKTIYTLDSSIGKIDIIVRFQSAENKFVLTIKPAHIRTKIGISIALERFDVEHLVRYLIEAPYIG